MLRGVLLCRRLLTSASRCSQVQYVGLNLHSVRKVQQIRPAIFSRRRPLAVCKSSRATTHTDASKVVAEAIKVIDDGTKLEITWNNGDISRFHAVWLRHHCRCKECYCTSSNQRLLRLDELPLGILIQNATLSDSGTIRLQWNDNNHNGEFTLEYLQKYCYSQRNLEKKKLSLKTSLYAKSCAPSVTWQDLEEEKNVYKWLSDINKHGLGLIKGAPSTTGLIVECIPRLIAPLLDNAYGKIYDVIAEENPINVAYTRKGLQFHMDLLYYESAPGIQILHCIKFDESIVGGETVFVDMFAVCEDFRRTNPVEFEILCSIPCTFDRVHDSRENPIHMYITRPIINLNIEKEIIGVYWSPITASELQIPEEEVTDFCRAKQLLARAVSNFHTKNVVRLKPGDIIAFNNRRMAHARNDFSSGSGERHLQGCYVNICEYKSRLTDLTQRYDDVLSIKRVGNMDWM